MTSRLEFFSPYDALEITQGGYTFYVISMSSKDLLRIAYTNPRNQNRKTGVQRGLDTRRLKEIGEYLQNPKKPGILPNSVIISLSKDARYVNGKLHIPIRDQGEAFILDGQHRLFAFGPDYYSAAPMNLLVSAFINLNNEMKAYVFQTINSNQRKINPSLVYDLIPMLRKDWVKFEDARAKAILDYLCETPSSPWYDGIDMLGGRERPITQASFISRLKTLFKRGNVFEDREDNDFYEEAIQINLLVEYFQVIKETFPRAWNNRNYILCKNTGFATMLNLLNPIIIDLRQKGKQLTDFNGLTVRKHDFEPYMKRISAVSFSSEEYGSVYLGEAGIRDLTEGLLSKIFE